MWEEKKKKSFTRKHCWEKEALLLKSLPLSCLLTVWHYIKAWNMMPTLRWWCKPAINTQSHQHSCSINLTQRSSLWRAEQNEFPHCGIIYSDHGHLWDAIKPCGSCCFWLFLSFPVWDLQEWYHFWEFSLLSFLHSCLKLHAYCQNICHTHYYS